MTENFASMLVLLEIAIGLALVYALGALVCTGMQEGIAQALRLRWKNLYKALDNLLEEKDLKLLLSHPLMKDVWDSSNRPTILPTPVVARALIHAFEKPEDVPSSDAEALLATIPVSVKRQIVPFLDPQDKTLKGLYCAAETWFDTSMKSASDRYAKFAHGISIGVAICLAIALNIDSLQIGATLAREPALRAAMTEVAKNTVSQYQKAPDTICTENSTDANARLQLCVESLMGKTGNDLIGWDQAAWHRIWPEKSRCPSFLGFLGAFAGWLVSGFAMSLGARFWFQQLSNLMSMRAGLASAIATATGAAPPKPDPD